MIDADLQLIYVNELVDLFFQKIIGPIEGSDTIRFKVNYTSENKVSEILLKLENYKKIYFEGHSFHELNSMFEVNLFNTLRSYMDHSSSYQVLLKKNPDQRGVFIETIRTSIGGQFSFSTSIPGITR